MRKRDQGVSTHQNMSKMHKYFAQNWHNLFISEFIFKNQPIKSLFSSTQAHLISGNPHLEQQQHDPYQDYV